MRLFDAFIYHKNDDPLAFYALLSDGKNVAKTFLFIFQTSCADAFIVSSSFFAWLPVNLHLDSSLHSGLSPVSCMGPKYQAMHPAHVYNIANIWWDTDNYRSQDWGSKWPLGAGIGITQQFAVIKPGVDVFTSECGRWITTCFSATLMWAHFNQYFHCDIDYYCFSTNLYSSCKFAIDKLHRQYWIIANLMRVFSSHCIPHLEEPWSSSQVQNWPVYGHSCERLIWSSTCASDGKDSVLLSLSWRVQRSIRMTPLHHLDNLFSNPIHSACSLVTFVAYLCKSNLQFPSLDSVSDTHHLTSPYSPLFYLYRQVLS